MHRSLKLGSPIHQLPLVIDEMVSFVQLIQCLLGGGGGDIPNDLPSWPHRKAKDVSWQSLPDVRTSHFSYKDGRMSSNNPLRAAAEQSAVIKFDNRRKFEVAS